METIRTDTSVKDIKGWTIPAGTDLFVVKQSSLTHPTKGHQVWVVRVDNGMGFDLSPETAIHVKGGKVISAFE